jgi:flavodoxin
MRGREKMNTLIIDDSTFGNTEQIARAMAGSEAGGEFLA